jgi:hypothetical protein
MPTARFVANRTALLAAAALLACQPAPREAHAGDVGTILRGLSAPLRAAHRERPATGCDDRIEQLAAEIDWLEHHIDAFGSIVAKQPDVWGQSRLTRHRQEYEDQMRRRVNAFAATSSAALRRSDQAFVGTALALQAAAGRRRGPEFVAVPDATGGGSVVNSIQTLLPTTNEQAGRADPVVIARTAPFQMPAPPAGLRFDDEPLALEPTVQLDHLSRYLNHLGELRRVNEGDDVADSPGYALNLVRLPVSILPGNRTQKGHGAEITVIAAPCLGDDLLPTTFRSLVVNDLVDLIAPALTHCVNDPQCRVWADTIVAPAADGQGHSVIDAMRSLRQRLPAIAPSTAPSVKTRRARMPIPFTQLADASGIRQIAILIRDTHTALADHSASRPCIGYLDVRGHLAEELEAAYDFLAQPRQQAAWAALPAWNLAELVRSRRAAEIARVRCEFLGGVGTGDDAAAAATGPAFIAGGPDGTCCDEPADATPICRTTTAILAWGILVESALLDERLAADMRDTCPAAAAGPFFGPDPSPEARQAFADYVLRRWPIRIFALDPVSDEQSVEDSYARRRELQVALAMAYASGRWNAQGLARYTRRLESELATVALNKTAVGFSHGSDTFGWRFLPRVQSPPTRGTLATIGETVRGGPTTDGDLLQRRLEPGQRECTAIVVMPSFVPALTLDVRTNWFSLAHPRATDQSLRQTMLLSRSVKAMQQSAAVCARHTHLYRDGELGRLLRRVDQLERELPLQTLDARIPHENTAGGFELFTTGITDLAPELIGWYGPPGIDPDGTTTLFIVGKGFSVHDTRVIAGGKPVNSALLSREVMRVEIPPGTRSIGGAGGGGCGDEANAAAVRGTARAGLVLVSATEPLPAPAARAAAASPASPSLPPPLGDPSDGRFDPPACESCRSPHACAMDCPNREVVDIHLATPYGVSSHLLVPVARRPPIVAGSHLAFEPGCDLRLSFTAARVAGTRTPAARIDEYFGTGCESIFIRVPEAFIPPAKPTLRLSIRDEAAGVVAAAVSFDALAFDARRSRYVIAGGDLRNLVGDTSRPAADRTIRGGLKPYVDHLLAQGAFDVDGDSRPFSVTAALVAGQQEIPVGGAIAVTLTRRDRTAVEPQADPAPETEAP